MQGRLEHHICGTTHEVKPALQWGLGASRAGVGNGCRVFSPPPPLGMGQSGAQTLQHLSGGDQVGSCLEPKTEHSSLMFWKLRQRSQWLNWNRENKAFFRATRFQMRAKQWWASCFENKGFPHLDRVVQVQVCYNPENSRHPSVVALTQALELLGEE